jgi:hypothetical protein
MLDFVLKVRHPAGNRYAVFAATGERRSQDADQCLPAVSTFFMEGFRDDS